MIDAAVVGASGYGGGELVRLLLHHPDVTLKTAISETYAGKPLSAAFPGLAGQSALNFERYGDGAQLTGHDVVFLAQENGKAMGMAPALIKAGCRVVDLSADFRFRTPATYETWYKTAHTAPDLNDQAVYGLPELYADRIKNARIVGNPGCYTTASILALTPLLQADLIETDSIIIDAKSGVSGAGRAKFGLDFHYAEANESVSAYKIAGTHRHTPEIEQAFRDVAGTDVTITFTPHLIPMSRGILATSYAKLKRTSALSDLIGLFKQRYADAPFVVVTGEQLPATKHTLGSNYCHIGLAVDERTGRVIVVSAIDNLIKGAAGQAIQNMNIMLDLKETAGLDFGGIWP